MEKIKYNALGQWTLEKSTDPSAYKTPKSFNKEETVAAVRQAIMAELDAINLYEAQFNATNDKELKKLLRHIIDEEKHHVEELQEWLDKNDIKVETDHSHGKEETQKG